MIKKEDPDLDVVDESKETGVLIDITGDVKLSQPDDDWVPPPTNTEANEKKFEEVDNPGY